MPSTPTTQAKLDREEGRKLTADGSSSRHYPFNAQQHEAARLKSALHVAGHIGGLPWAALDHSRRGPPTASLPARRLCRALLPALVPAFTGSRFMIQHWDDSQGCGGPAFAGGSVGA